MKLKAKLIYLDERILKIEKENKEYHIFYFLDWESLKTITGTNLDGKFESFKVYDLELEYKNDKLKVKSLA